MSVTLVLPDFVEYHFFFLGYEIIFCYFQCRAVRLVLLRAELKSANSYKIQRVVSRISTRDPRYEQTTVLNLPQI